MSSWRDRAKPVNTLPNMPVKNKAYVDDVGLPDMTQADVLNQIAPQQEQQKTNWRDRAKPVSLKPIQPAQEPAQPKERTWSEFGQSLVPNPADMARGMWRGVEGGTAAVGAGIASAVEGVPFKEGYKQAMESYQTPEFRAAEERSPVSFGAGKLASEVALTNPVVKGASAVIGAGKNIPLVGQTLEAVSKGTGLVGKTAQGGMYGAATGFTEGKPVEGALSGAATFGALAGAGKLAKGVAKGAENVVAGINAKSMEQADQVANAMRKEASALYKKSKDLGAVLAPKKAVNIYNKMESAVTTAGKVNQRIHGDTLSVLSDIKDHVKSKNPLSLEELDQYRQLLDDVITKNTDVAGKINADAYRAVQAKKALDDSVSTLGKIDILGGKTESVEALLAGRAKWLQKSKYEAITRELKKAGGDPNKIKTRLTNFLNDPRKTKGFNQEDLKALRIAAKSTWGEKTLKGLGRFGIDPSNVYLPLMTGGLGGAGSALGAGTGPYAAALIGAGTVARPTAKLIAQGKADKILKAIEKGK